MMDVARPSTIKSPETESLSLSEPVSNEPILSLTVNMDEVYYSADSELGLMDLAKMNLNGLGHKTSTSDRTSCTRKEDYGKGKGKKKKERQNRRGKKGSH